MWKLLLMAAFGCALILGIVNTGKASNKGQLKSFRYVWADPSKIGCEEVFEAKADGPEYVNVMTKSYDTNGEVVLYTGKFKRDEFMAGLEELSEKRCLEQWNGFCKNNADKPGNTFHLEAAYSDGHNIVASGNNSMPNGYGPAVKDIRAYFKANCK